MNEPKFKLLLTLNRENMRQGIQFFNGDTPPGGDTPPTDEPKDTPTDEPKGDEKTFSQEDVNNLIAKEKKAAQEKLLKEAGFTDFKTLKEGMEQFKQWTESQKTDAQKQAEALETSNKSLEETTSKLADTEAQLAALKLDADPEKLTDLIVLAKTRVTDEVTMDEAIKQTLEQYPQFKKGAQQADEEKPPAPQFTPGSPTPPAGGKDDPFTAKLAKYK